MSARFNDADYIRLRYSLSEDVSENLLPHAILLPTTHCLAVSAVRTTISRHRSRQSPAYFSSVDTRGWSSRLNRVTDEKTRQGRWLQQQEMGGLVYALYLRWVCLIGCTCVGLALLASPPRSVSATRTARLPRKSQHRLRLCRSVTDQRLAARRKSCMQLLPDPETREL